MERERSWHSRITLACLSRARVARAPYIFHTPATQAIITLSCVLIISIYGVDSLITLFMRWFVHLDCSCREYSRKNELSISSLLYHCHFAGKTIAGTTDSPTELSYNPPPKEAEIQFILSEIKHYLSADVEGELLLKTTFRGISYEDWSRCQQAKFPRLQNRCSSFEGRGWKCEALKIRANSRDLKCRKRRFSRETLAPCCVCVCEASLHNISFSDTGILGKRKSELLNLWPSDY